jgi:radical SAM superfamily enzyme YgiQ (UPF0313 family)
VADTPLLRFALTDGRPASLLVGEASTVLAIDERLVSSWDLAGRPYALVRDDGTYRRGLDGRFLRKREATAGAPRLRQTLSAAEGAPVVEAARREAEAALSGIRDGAPEEALRRLRRVVATDTRVLLADAARFLAASGPVGILPPDQYLSLVVRITEGCSWNACGFCRLYRDVPFRFKKPDELRAHLAALREYFGESLALRRSVFLGDANALCLDDERLRPLLGAVAEEFRGAPLFSFVDAWSGRRRELSAWREYAARGLRRVYVGLETGDPALHAWLGKPGSPEDALALVAALHGAGVAVGVIVLLGAGGERFADAHVTRTAALLSEMRLESEDLVYFSEYVEEPGLAYAARSSDAPDVTPLSPDRCAEARHAILAAFRPGDPARPPRSASYDLREFVY